MKLASYKDGSRDGQLVVVSRDLSQAHYASHVASRLQQVLDDWNFLSPQLQDIFDALNAGRARHAFAFDPSRCLAPLPRAYQVALADAYPARRALINRAAGQPDESVGLPCTQWAGDSLLGAQDPLHVATESWGVDFGACVAVISGDIPLDCAPDRALDGVRLLALCNAVSLRHLEAPAGMPTVQSQCAMAFSPVVVTPDELGEAWQRGRLHLPVQCSWNGRKVGMGDAGANMGPHFGQLLAHLAKTRALRAGSVVVAGPVSQAASEQAGAPSWSAGFHSIAEKRAMEKLQDGQAASGYLRFGDTIRIDMKNAAGQSVFGAIEQELAPLA